MATLIVVATMTGTAEMVGEDILAAIGPERAQMLPAERVDLSASLNGVETLLVVSSTYGNGEVPEPAKPLYAAIESANRLQGPVRYGVIGLGDKSLYPDTFARGGQLWDSLLADKGLARASDPLLVDCSTSQAISDESIAWVQTWLMAEGVH